MQKLLITVLTVLLVTLSACNSEQSPNTKQDQQQKPLKKKPITLKEQPQLRGNYTLTDSTAITDIPEQTFLMGAFAQMLQQKTANQLDSFVQQSTDLGFDQDAFSILYQATHQAFNAMRYKFIQSLVDDVTADNKWVTNALTAPIKPSILDKISVALQTKEIEAGKPGLSRSLVIRQTYTDPNCSFGAESCDVQLDIDVDFEFPWPHAKILSTEETHTLEMGNVGTKINTFKISNAHASFELTLSNAYISEYTASIPNQDAGTQNRETYIEKLRADFGVTFINNTIKEDGTEGKVKISGLIIGSYSMMTLLTDFDANSITVDDIDSYAQINLIAEEI